MEMLMLNPNHAKAYRTIRLEALKNHPEAYASSFEEENNMPLEITEKRLLDHANMTFGALDDTKLIGIATLMTSTRLKTKHNGHIVAVYVDIEHRNRGIARSLLKIMIEEAKKLGIKNLYLTVTAINEEAYHLYLSLGFKVYGVEKNVIYVHDMYYDSRLMVLHL